jgi:limonene-1,2-epoxide hydrolase
VPLARRTRPAVEAFVAALADAGVRAALREIGFTPAPGAGVAP